MQSTGELNRARSLALAVSLYTIMILRQERIDTEAPFMASSAKAGCRIFHTTPMIKSTGRLTIFQTLVGTIKQHSPHSGQYLSNVTINEHQINKT
jgi:hypothetical protein